MSAEPGRPLPPDSSACIATSTGPAAEGRLAHAASSRAAKQAKDADRASEGSSAWEKKAWLHCARQLVIQGQIIIQKCSLGQYLCQHGFSDTNTQQTRKSPTMQRWQQLFCLHNRVATLRRVGRGAVEALEQACQEGGFTGRWSAGGWAWHCLIRFRSAQRLVWRAVALDRCQVVVSNW